MTVSSSNAAARDGRSGEGPWPAPDLYEAHYHRLGLGSMARLYGKLFGFPLATDWLRFRRVLSCLPSAAPRRLLDVGCGHANMLFYAARAFPSADVVGIDASHEVVARNRAVAGSMGLKNVRIEAGDWRDTLPSLGEGFDVVLLMDVLTEVVEQESLLRMIRDVLTPGGRLILGNAMPSPARALVDFVDPYWQQPQLHAAVRRLGLFELLRGAGYSVERVQWLAGLPFGVPAHCVDMAFYKSRGVKQVAHAFIYPLLKASVAAELLVPPIMPTGVVVSARRP